MAQDPRDLFGDIPVTQYEIDAWLATVPRLPIGSTRRESYTRGYRVVEKIQRAKLDGDLLEIVAHDCPYCGAALLKEKPAL